MEEQDIQKYYKSIEQGDFDTAKKLLQEFPYLCDLIIFKENQRISYENKSKLYKLFINFDKYKIKYKEDNKILSYNSEDRDLLYKAASLLGEYTRVMGICGDIETVRLIKFIGISNNNGRKEVGFITSDPFYSKLYFGRESIMNWNYYK